jgi:hypothetical protein
VLVPEYFQDSTGVVSIKEVSLNATSWVGKFVNQISNPSLLAASPDAVADSPPTSVKVVQVPAVDPKNSLKLGASNVQPTGFIASILMLLNPDDPVLCKRERPQLFPRIGGPVTTKSAKTGNAPISATSRNTLNVCLTIYTAPQESDYFANTFSIAIRRPIGCPCAKSVKR